MAKRSRDEYESVHDLKRRRLEAETFQIEPIEVSELCLKKLFCTDTYMIHHNVIKFPDQNENLLSAVDDLNAYKKEVFANASVNMLSECKRIALKLKRIASPIDVKFDANNSTKMEDNIASAMDGIEAQYATAKEETFDRSSSFWNDSGETKEVKPVVVVKREVDENQVDHSHQSTPITAEITTTYPGQLLWAQYQKYPYWPAIVCVPETDATNDQSK